jgi:TRAP-type C4-dicarboxylate transport system substrate-binding protein
MQSYAIANENRRTRAIAYMLPAVLSLLLSPSARSEPAQLKLSFFTSDRSKIYQYSVKPFVEAVNRDGRGVVEVVPEFSDPRTKVQVDQPRLVADGTIDMAIFAPGLRPDRFGDTAVMELPGLFNDMREAGLVFTRLIRANALKGYDEFFVVGAFVSGAESIHSRVPINANKDLAGLTIRTNNNVEANVLGRFGAKTKRLSINRTTEAISRGTIDGATFPPGVLFEFGVGRLTPYHYMIKLGGAPNVLIMNRKKFESLPPQAQAIIRKYSGQWLVERSAASFEALDKKIVARLRSESRRKVVFPSPSDVKDAQRVFTAVIADWAARNPHNGQLLAKVKAEIAKFRPSTEVRP